MDISSLIPSQSPVDDEGTRYELYEAMCRAWGIEPRDVSHNPCPMAVTLEAHHLDKHAASDYLVVPKTDGIRYLLLLTMTTHGAHAVMIGRDMCMYEIEVWAPLSFFESGTLLDGELAWTREGTMSYFAFDAMAIEGRRLSRQPLVERLHAVRQALELTSRHHEALAQHAETTDDADLAFVVEEKKVVATTSNSYGLCLIPKGMLSAEDWAEGEQWSAWSDCQATASDGLVFTPMHLPVYLNTHRAMFKWKPRDQLTVDFLCRANRVHLVDEHGEVVPVRSIEGLPLVFAEPEIDDGVFECRLAVSDAEVRATPDRRRPDKLRPNTVATAAAAVRSVRDYVDERALRAWATRRSR